MKTVRLSIATLVLIALAGPLAAQDRPYIDPALRPLMVPGADRAAAPPVRPPALPRAATTPAERAAAAARTGAGELAVRRDPVDGILWIGLIVRLRGPGGLDELRAAGAEIGSVAADIATARLPVQSLPQLADARTLAHIEAARVLVINHDSSMRAIRADRVRQVTGGEWTGNTGRGAVVAIYDSGVDFRHPDFIAPDGTTRVLELWDQTTAGSPPAGFNYGFFCSRDAVQAAIAGNAGACPQRDLVGHGTHVAGSAVGNGAGSPQFQYAGVAPEAELIVVKGGDAGFSENLLLDGLRWLEQRGAALGRPVVVNLSLGDQYGPHDGTRLLEREIDRLSRSGFIVVNSAGNSGENYNTVPEEPFHILIHARAAAILGQTSQFTFVVDYTTPHPDACNGNIALFSLWHHPTDRVRLTITRPNGTTATAAPGERVTANSPVGQIHIDNGAGGSDPESGLIHVFIQVSGCGQSGPPAPGTWRIGVETVAGGTGSPFDIWLWYQNVGTGAADHVRGAQNFDNRFNISSPGNARRVITVGAFATRMCWPVAEGGQVCYTNREEIGDIARFSSAGPTRDGRMKPEITAPGIAVVSSLSGDAIPNPNRVVGLRHWALEGTSMAAPHVSGAIALLLAERPDLTPEDIVAILGFSARQDAFTQRTYGPFPGGRPEDWWGLGKLDVEAAVGGITDDIPIAQLVVTPAVDTLPVGATLQMRVQAFGPDGQQFFARASWHSTNPEVASVDERGLVTALAPGITLIVASAQERSDTAVIVVQPPATVAITTASASPAAPVLAPRGTRIPLLRVTLSASGPEAVDLHQLGLDVTGNDPEARIVVHHDVDGDGTISPGDPEIGSADVALTPAARRIVVPITFRIPRNATVHLVVGVRVSGAAPNLAQFRATLVPDETRTVGVRSGALDRFNFTAPPVASAPAITTLLPADQVFSLSENPVRGTELVLNFSERPRTVAVYTIAGARVAELTARLDGDTRIRWNLTNDRAQRIAPGVYLLVIETAATTIREKLFILTPAAAGLE